MDTSDHLVVFTLDEQRFALPLAAVERVVRVVEVTPLPQAPENVVGVINVQGRIIPVIDIRRRFRLPPREMELSDELIIAHTSHWAVAVVVDAVTGVAECPEQEVTEAGQILPGAEQVDGVVKLSGELIILIRDLDRFLSPQEQQELHQAISAEVA